MGKQLIELKETLCEELEKFARKDNFSTGDLDIIKKLTSSIKNLCIIMEDDDGGYSQNSGNYSRNDGGSSYDGGYSYRGGRSGKHYVRGHYSRDDGKNYMRMKLEEMMRESSDDNVRNAIRQCVEQIDEI